MDGKGCWRDNVFVERLWKNVTYEEVYLHAYVTRGVFASGMFSVIVTTSSMNV